MAVYFGVLKSGLGGPRRLGRDGGGGGYVDERDPEIGYVGSHEKWNVPVTR